MKDLGMLLIAAIAFKMANIHIIFLIIFVVLLLAVCIKYIKRTKN